MASYLKSIQKTGNSENIPLLDTVTTRISDIFGKYGSGLAIKSEVGLSETNPDSSL